PCRAGRLGCRQEPLRWETPRGPCPPSSAPPTCGSDEARAGSRRSPRCSRSPARASERVRGLYRAGSHEDNATVRSPRTLTPKTDQKRETLRATPLDPPTPAWAHAVEVIAARLGAVAVEMHANRAAPG